LYSALNDKAPEAFRNGFLDASAWPLRPFVSFVLPLVSAAKEGREFDVMQILRRLSPMFSQEGLKGVNVAERLAHARDLTEKLVAMMADGSMTTTAQVLHLLHETGVIPLDERVLSYLNIGPANGAASVVTEDEDDGEELSKEIAAMEAFLVCPVVQFWGYQKYINEQSPFSTQQGIKGAEFERVLVVLDDDEGTHVQFSYEKLLGLKPLSDRDVANVRDGKETAVERTRRLFYVCCTRALQDLVVVLFSSDPDAAKLQISSMGLFLPEAIHGLTDLQVA
jgi:DNA helicase II / ATP-dependent DNA helicase PcrA